MSDLRRITAVIRYRSWSDTQALILPAAGHVKAPAYRNRYPSSALRWSSACYPVKGKGNSLPKKTGAKVLALKDSFPVVSRSGVLAGGPSIMPRRWERPVAIFDHSQAFFSTRGPKGRASISTANIRSGHGQTVLARYRGPGRF